MLVSGGKHSKIRRGGTIVNVLTAVVFFGLIGAGLWWIIKTAGQAGQQYSEAMIETTDKATKLTCQANLRTIGQNLQMYAISNNEFPASQEDLVRWGGPGAPGCLPGSERRDLRVCPRSGGESACDERGGLRTQRRSRRSV